MGICSIYILWMSKRFKTNRFIITHTHKDTRRVIGTIASPNTRSLNLQTKVYRRSYPEEISSNHADNVFVSLSLSLYVYWSDFMHIRKRLVLWRSPPKCPSVNGCSWQGAASAAAACGEITQDTEYVIASHTRREKAVELQTQNWLGLLGLLLGLICCRTDK